jgi:8-oxo-dGTP pyrophosphatase MutT (NUDIX family)
MPQKYKVFIGDNPLLIIAPELAQSVDLSDITISVKPTEYELQEVYRDLIRHKNQTAMWISPEPDTAFKQLCGQFKMVEAAGGIVQLGSKFLFILRHGKWDLPKGKAEKGESRSETARREVEEECGFEVDEVANLAGITYHTYERDNARVLKPSYWFWMSVDEMPVLIPQEEEGITRVEFLDAPEIHAILDDMYVSIKELVLALGLNHPKP